MTDRHTGYLVMLERDTRDDEAAVAAAIGQLKGVLQVVPVPADVRQAIATERARHDLRAQMAALLWPPPPTSPST